jgi:DNA polymerase-3 subunit delta
MISALHQLSSDSQVSGTTPITADKVAVLYSGRVEASGFAVADAAVEGRLGDALLAARQAVDTGTDPVVLVNALASVLRTLAKVGAAGRSAKSFELAGVLGLAPWQIDKARRQLPGWNGDGITTAITAIAHADSQVKGGGSDPIYALEVALVAVAGAKNS